MDNNFTMDFIIGEASNISSFRPLSPVFQTLQMKPMLPDIKEVIFNDPATIVYWKDGSKTVVKCQAERGDTYSKEVGLVTAIAKKALGNKGNFNDVIAKWVKNK